MNSSLNSSFPLFSPSSSSPFISFLSKWLDPDRLFPNTSLAFRLYHRLDLTNLRQIFYLTTPWESSFGSLEEVPNYNVQVSAWWMMLITIEFVVLSLIGHSDRFTLNDSITSVSAGMLSQCFKFGGRAVAIFAYIWIWDNFRLIELPWDSPWTWALCLVTQDFVYYLGHRAIHEAGFFWGLHTIHHSSQYFNLSTALRQAAIQDAGLAIYDVLQAFFIPPPIFLVHRYFSEIFQFWMHTSLLGSLGPLGWVLNTPSHHRVHHGRNPYCIDRNFGGVLIIWDRLFGTFEAERPSDPPIYGLIKNEDSFNQIWLQFHTLKELLLDKWRLKDSKGMPIFPGPLDKIRALLYPPGWFPGVPVRPFFHWATLRHSSQDVPQPEVPPVVYNPQLAPWLKAYILGHFLLLLAIFMHFEYDRDNLDWADFGLKLAFFICSMQSFGSFFDLRPWAPFLELFRCAGVVSYYSARMALEEDGVRPNRLFVGSIFTFFAIFWAVRISIQSFRELRKRRGKVGDKEADEGGGGGGEGKTQKGMAQSKMGQKDQADLHEEKKEADGSMEGGERQKG